ncbi:putative multidrug resistance protein MdtD [Pseudomonas reidholzensis]|uniref:Putative multidrug resistance protein MdtD n=1 Tax=Pseudomonas reidholzensis TaxID=1785162 RepID=A0A383RU54_9PSED|nr:MFS transporter [Pseudomonas reidholzensis]SYX90036.1 putative multidrug resistance protein MdtD [Pseudomonas reidholzensis]
MPQVTLSAHDRTIIGVLVLGIALPLLDTTLVNLSLHNIGDQLGAPLSMMQWVVTAYTLAAAAAVPLSAWLAARMGAKKLWIISLWLFLIGTALAALAPNVEYLIFSRVLQGIATGLLLPTMQTLVVIGMGQNKTRAALSAMSVPSVLAPILGPLVGGLVLQFFDWRLIFWLHIPICILAIVFASRVIPHADPIPAHPFDGTGFLLLCLGLVAVFYGLSLLSTQANPAWLPSLLAGICLMMAFTWHAYRKKQSALIDIRIFREGKFGACCTLLFLSSIAHYGGILLYPLYLIQAGIYPVQVVGLLVALHGVGILLARQRLTKTCLRWGDRNVAQGAIALALVGSTALLLPPAAYSVYFTAFGMFTRGSGLGILTLLAMSGAYQGLTVAQVAHGSSLSRLVTHLGAATGTTLIVVTAVSVGGLGTEHALDYFYGHIALIAALALCAFASSRLE